MFVWVDDVAAAMVRAASDGPAGIYNVAGTGALTVPEIARRLGKPLLTVPAWALGFALRVGHATVERYLRRYRRRRLLMSYGIFIFMPVVIIVILALFV